MEKKRRYIILGIGIILLIVGLIAVIISVNVYQDNQALGDSLLGFGLPFIVIGSLITLVIMYKLLTIGYHTKLT